MRHLLLILLVLAFGGVLRAQSQDEAWLEGTLVSKTDKAPLVNAFVVLRTADGADTPFSTLTDEKGYFLLKGRVGKYRLATTFVQQTIVLRPALELPAGRLQLGTLPVELTRELESVVVKGKMPLVRYDGSTLIFGEAAFAKARGGSVLDGLTLIPGLQIEGANKLKLYGLSELAVYIDGRAQRMSQDEVIALLRSMSVSEIAQVELIREPGVEYSGVTMPILNIKRKTRADEGIKGFSSLVGTYQHYLSEQLSTRVNFNYGRSRSYLSYSFGDKRQRETTTFSKRYVDDQRTDSRRSHQVALGTDLTLGKGHSLGGQFIGNYASERLLLASQRSNRLQWLNLYGSLYHTFRSHSWTLQTTAEGSRGSSDLRREQGSGAVASEDDNRFVRLALDVSHQLSGTFSLALGAEASHIAVDTRLSNRAEAVTLRELDVEGYASLGFRLQPFNGHIGLRIAGEDRTGSSGVGLGNFSRSGAELLPYASLRYDLARNHQIALTHSSSYTRPNYRDLLGYTSEASALLSREGNADLKTSYRRSWALNYSYLRAAQLELSYVDTEAPIVEAVASQGAGYVLHRYNLDYSRYLRVLLVLPVPIIYHGEVSWIASTYLAAQRQWDRGRINVADYRQTFNAHYIQHTHSFSFPTGWTADLGVTYYSALMYGLYRMQPQWWVNASLSKQMGDLRVSLSAHDLFNTNIARGAYALAAPALSFERNWYSPRLQLTLSYSWGKKTVKAQDARARYDDLKRLSTGANEGLNVSTL